MASGLCQNIKHVILHSPMELANQNEDNASSPCSSSASRNTCLQQTDCVLLPAAILLNGAYRKCSTHHSAALWSPLLVHVSAIVDERSRNLWFQLQHFFSYSANNYIFFLFVDASKNTGGSPGLALGAAGCGIHYRQISPYHQLCLVDNTFTATRPVDLWGAWCVHLVLQTTECELANIVKRQKRLATYLTAKAGVHKCVYAPSLLNRSNLQTRCQLTQNEDFFVCFWQPTPARGKRRPLALSKLQVVVHGATATGVPECLNFVENSG